MSDIVSPLLQWLNANPEWAGLATFVISAAESVAIIGTIVPGSITMTAVGALAGAGVIPLGQTIFLAMLGAIMGDGISYWVGHYFKQRLRKMWPFSTNPGILKKGEHFVHHYGVMSVFIGRFVGPVRALVPLVAGMLGMKPLQFTIANITSAIGWAPAYMLPGILLGAASLELPPDIAAHVMLVLIMIFLFILLCLWIIWKICQLVHFQTSQYMTSIWEYMKQRRRYKLFIWLLKHQDSKRAYGQLERAFYLIVTLLLLCLLIIAVKYYGASNLSINDIVFHLFRGIRTEAADQVMLMITLLGEKHVILPVVAVVSLWLAAFKRWRTAAHAAALGILTAGSVFALKHMIKSPRPWGIMQNPDMYSMPSGHTTLSLTIYLGIAFLAVSSLNRFWRWSGYFIALVVAFAVAISRLYLNAHWFTDILSAWLLSAGILLAVVISYQREREKPVSALGMLCISLATLAISYSACYQLTYEHIKTNYTQTTWPTITLTMNEWWTRNNSLPAYRTSLFGFPSQKINIEWSGDLDLIINVLAKEGWDKPPARDLISTLHRIADIESSQYLPLISPQYLDQKPLVTLARRTEKNSLLVLRLWNSNRLIKETGKPVWVGTIGVVPRSYSWLRKKHPGELTINPSLLFPVESKTLDWDMKTVWVYQPTGRKDMIDQKILLIRPKKP